MNIGTMCIVALDVTDNLVGKRAHRTLLRIPEEAVSRVLPRKPLDDDLIRVEAQRRGWGKRQYCLGTIEPLMVHTSRKLQNIVPIQLSAVEQQFLGMARKKTEGKQQDHPQHPPDGASVGTILPGNPST